MKKETRGRKLSEIDPVKKGDGDWIRLGKAKKRINKHANTVKELARRNKIKTKVEDGVIFYYIRKEVNK